VDRGLKLKRMILLIENTQATELIGFLFRQIRISNSTSDSKKVVTML
jgi:hypothetical protein